MLLEQLVQLALLLQAQKLCFDPLTVQQLVQQALQEPWLLVFVQQQIGPALR